MHYIPSIVGNSGLSSLAPARLIKLGKLGDEPMPDEHDALFGNERRTRIILLLLALLCVGVLALLAGYLFFNLFFEPYSPGRFLW